MRKQSFLPAYYWHPSCCQLVGEIQNLPILLIALPVAETEKETEASTEEAKEEKQALSIAEQKNMGTGWTLCYCDWNFYRWTYRAGIKSSY